ncbi:MAG: TIGR04211 family SH3 domain-containing protein [Cardiobacteriaceae bacterium]|nr:TIGR04211 family SH3 domain-containing protein [Cardiobacteriaceae bacterium]
MNKYFSLVAIVCCVGVATAAQNAWISDELRTAVYDKPGRDAKFLGTLRSGESVELLEKNGDYAHIKTGEVNGWVSIHSIMDTPSIQSRFIEQQQRLEQLQGQAQVLQSANSDQNQSLDVLKKQLQDLQASEQKARDELVSLQRASGNAIAIDQRNRELQAAMVTLEQENLGLKHRNTRLEETLNQKQLYAGGFLVFAGFVLHWLSGIFRFSQRRKSSFDDL